MKFNASIANDHRKKTGVPCCIGRKFFSHCMYFNRRGFAQYCNDVFGGTILARNKWAEVSVLQEFNERYFQFAFFHTDACAIE